MSRLLQYSFPGRPGGLAPDSIEEWGSGDSTDDLARRADESDLSQGGKRRHRHRRSSQAPRPSLRVVAAVASAAFADKGDEL